MMNDEQKERGWWWQALRDPRIPGGWASTTKLQVLIASFVASFVIIFLMIRGEVPNYAPELLGTYMAIIILGRGASKFLSIWENKKEEKKNNGDHS